MNLPEGEERKGTHKADRGEEVAGEQRLGAEA